MWQNSDPPWEEEGMNGAERKLCGDGSFDVGVHRTVHTGQSHRKVICISPYTNSTLIKSSSCTQVLSAGASLQIVIKS